MVEERDNIIFAAGVDEFADQVALCGRVRGVEFVQSAGIVEGKALMMTCRQNDVAHSRGFRQTRQRLRIEIFCGEGILQFLIFRWRNTAVGLYPLGTAELGIESEVNKHAESELFKSRDPGKRFRYCHVVNPYFKFEWFDCL